MNSLVENLRDAVRMPGKSTGFRSCGHSYFGAWYETVKQ